MFLVKTEEINKMEAMQESVSDFSRWLEGELNKRDWQPYTLSQKAGLGNSTISRILAGDRNPGPEVCTAIAKALDERPEDVFRIAGLLPPSFGELSDLSEKERELVELFRQLPDHQDAVLSIMRGMIPKYGTNNDQR